MRGLEYTSPTPSGSAASSTDQGPQSGISGNHAGRMVAWAGALTATLVTASPLLRATYIDGPPPAHTGGFGGDTCHACHFENDLDTPGGSLTLGGVPDTFDPSRTYRITVSLARPGMGRAGFQLAARLSGGDAPGSPAGVLQGLGGDERVEVVDAPDGGTYAQHTEPGTTLSSPATAVWILEWRPPDASAGTVAFHAAANAANDDASEFGDFIYTASATTRPASP